MNRSTTIALGIVTGFLFSATTPVAHAEPSHPGSTRFTFGGSVWGTVSYAENEFFKIALSEDPVDRLKEWVEHGTVTDLCYAMVGIHYFDETLFAELREEYSGRDLVIWDQIGCLVDSQPLEVVFERIGSGAYTRRVELGIERGGPPVYRWDEGAYGGRDERDDDWTLESLIDFDDEGGDVPARAAVVIGDMPGFLLHPEEEVGDALVTERPWIWVSEDEERPTEVRDTQERGLHPPTRPE